jgi:hypothetical protein
MKIAMFIAVRVCALPSCALAQSQDAPPVVPPSQQVGPATNPKTNETTNTDLVELARIDLSDDVIIDTFEPIGRINQPFNISVPRR